MSAEVLYFACIAGSHGHINIKLKPEPMTRDECERYLKANYLRAWLNCNAIPQPINHDYFKG